MNRRCLAFAGKGACNRLLDKHGKCDRAATHVVFEVSIKHKGASEERWHNGPLRNASPQGNRNRYL